MTMDTNTVMVPQAAANGHCYPVPRLLAACLGLVMCLAAAPSICAQGPSRPQGRIAIREGHFVAMDTAQLFVPWGCNYIRLRPQTQGLIEHANFDPQYYDRGRVADMFRNLAAHDLNTVRIFIDATSPGVGLFESRKATELSTIYMDNVCDFLHQARENDIYVLVAFDMWGPNCAWLQQGPGAAPMVSGPNALWFKPGAAETRAALLAEFAKAVKARDAALLTTILAFEIQNELCYFMDAEPLSRLQGTFRYEGREYDLATEESRQQLMDDVSVHWCNTSVEAVHRIDPQALVSVSVFSFNAVGRSGPSHARRDQTRDNRMPARPLALAGSALSYVDVHIYPHGPGSVQRDLQSIEFDETRAKCLQMGKPLMMGEFGAFKQDYPDLPGAVQAMEQHVPFSRDKGFQGFLFWTYDTNEQQELWNLKSEDAPMLEALAHIEVGQRPRQGR